MTQTYEEYLTLIEKSAASENLDDFRLARQEFHKLSGEFEEGEPWFETRMTMFLDWYLLERKGFDNLTPNERYLRENHNSLDSEAVQQLNDFKTSLRSVFQLEKREEKRILVNDLVRGGQWNTLWTLPVTGLKQNSILNSRIILSRGEFLLGRGTVLHPFEAHETIMHILERAKKERLPFGRIVAYMDKVKLKLDRYSNVKIKHVYQYPTDAVF